MLTMRLSRRRSSAIAAALALAATVATAASAGAATAPAPHLAAADVNAAWQFPAKNWSKSNKEAGRVDDILRVGKRVFIGGNFTITANHSGKTVTRTYLASENATSGALLDWKPALNGRVYALAVSPNHKTLYVAGSFTKVNGKSRSHVASFDIATGGITSAIPDMGINGSVRAITRSGASIYIGGSFTQVAGHSHSHLAKLTHTGRRFAVAGWNASADDDVRDLIADRAGNRVIVAGWFKSLDGLKAQHHLASVSMTTGRPLPWVGHPAHPVLDITRSGKRVYAAVAGPGAMAEAFSARTGKRAWFYMTDGNVQAVTTVRGYPVFGMHGNEVSPHANQKMWEYAKTTRIKRDKIFELSPKGVLQKWHPNLGTTQGVLGVWALKSGKGMLYVGGDFTLVNGTQQNRFAMFPQING